ncbi:putative F-box domain-containing protein [Helianthus annuus]|uniref:F-box domain-containing protein n=1 Tax=Helianthus annuus TaxID=4232 RepID=A0A9K3DVC6_HELAN|nr:putative F-box domain-containing protein [Helianthus annuus]KAJ0822800.1 putative F-box domain-containing protein [Helianthus annuus]
MEEDSDHQPTQSGALIGSNDDLLTEILLRLPVTSILRFKSVSKHWRLHLRHTHFTHSLYFYPDPRGIRIVQSCNGLLLCCTYRGSIDTRKYYVFNPTTKQFRFIPSLPGGLKVRRSILHMGLAFHPTDCVHYKLVCTRLVKPAKDLLQVQIYSSDTGKWKICPVTFHSSWLFFQQQGVYWNGAFYLVPSYDNHLHFKIEAQQWHTFPLPVEMTSLEWSTLYFGESRGHLHLIVCKNFLDYNTLHLNVYEMLSDHSGWFVKYQLQLPELWATFPEMTLYRYVFKVVDVVRGEKEEDTFMVLQIPRKFIRLS